MPSVNKVPKASASAVAQKNLSPVSVVPLLLHLNARGQQGTEGERLGGRPVEALAGLDHLPLGLELADDLAVDVEALGILRELEPDRAQGLGRDPRGAAPVVARRGREARPFTLEPVGLVGPVAARGLELLVEIF